MAFFLSLSDLKLMNMKCRWTRHVAYHVKLKQIENLFSEHWETRMLMMNIGEIGSEEMSSTELVQRRSEDG
jgi:hypothetical protein